MISGNDRRSASLGVIGLGIMGAPMARNAHAALAGSGDVAVTGRSRERVAPLLEEDLVWVGTPREVAERAAVVLLMLPDLPQIEPLLDGQDGLLAGTEPLVLAVGSSVSPVRVREVGERVRDSTGGRVRMIDCPVSGGEEGAVAGTLSIMVGGEDEPVATATPLLATMGRPVHLGPLGAGSVAKACNQMIVAATTLALGEAVVVAERSGIDLAALLDLLGGGYAGSRLLETRKRRFVEHDHSPSGPVKYLLKDLGFAAAAAEATGTGVTELPAVRAAFEELVAAGLGDQDLAVVQRFIEERRNDGSPRRP
jgi:2-hydroxy-3-oxopropionate reductase